MYTRLVWEMTVNMENGRALSKSDREDTLVTMALCPNNSYNLVSMTRVIKGTEDHVMFVNYTSYSSYY